MSSDRSWRGWIRQRKSGLATAFAHEESLDGRAGWLLLPLIGDCLGATGTTLDVVMLYLIIEFWQ